jgi:hypothetical protein
MKKIIIIVINVLLLIVLVAGSLQSAENIPASNIPENLYENLYKSLPVENPYEMPTLGPKGNQIPLKTPSAEGDEVIFSYENSALWNGMKDVKVKGNYAYCAFNYGLLILDISNVSNPQPVSQVFMPDGDAWRIALDSNYAYVADGYGGLQIADISEPSQASLIGALETSGYCYDVAVLGDYAILADGSGGFRVINISDRTNPQQVASLPLSAETMAIAIQADFAYIGCGHDGLKVVDISDITNPVPRGTLGDIGNLLDLEVRGNYAFLAAEVRGIFSADISNPDEPFLASQRISKIGALGITLKDDYAYVTYGMASGLQVFDVSDPIIPRHVTQLEIPGSTLGVSVSGDFAFVAGWYSGLQIIDISTPAQAYMAGAYHTIGSVESVTADNDYFYVARAGWYIGDGSMQIVKFNDNHIPEILSEIFLEGSAAMDVQVEGDYAYVSDVSNGLQIIDISDRLNPRIIGSLPLAGHSLKIALAGDMAYLANDSLGLVIIDISLKNSPGLVGQYDNQGFISGIAADGNYVYLADTKNGLQIIDVRSPSAPNLAGTFPTAGQAMDVEVDGNLAYLVDESDGLSILDISNRQNPAIIQKLGDLHNPVHVELDDIFAYVTDVYQGIRIYNVSEPGNAYNAGGYPTPGYAWDVSIVNDKSVIADYYGLLLLGMQRPELAFEPHSLTFEGNQDGYQPDDQAFRVQNIGAGSLVWRVSSSQPWLNLDPSEGIDNSEINVRADITGLLEGIYYDTIIIASNAINPLEYLPVEFIVNAPNNPPRFDEIADREVDENSSLLVTITARDEDGTTPALFADNLPLNSSFNDNGDGSGSFDFNPDFTQAGEYRVVFIAVDAVDSNLADTAVMTITVNNVNRNPLFHTAMRDKIMVEDDVYAMNVSATDPDGDPITLTCAGKPDNATFEDYSNGSGYFEFISDYRNVNQKYNITFTASDNLGGMTADTISVTVTNRQLEVMAVDPNPPANGVKDILISDPILITFNEAIDETSLEENITITSANGDHLEYRYDSESYQIIITNPAGYFSELDAISITLDKDIKDLSGIAMTESVYKTILTGVTVYAGDANDDGKVNEMDILPLGLYWQSTGPVRGSEPNCEWGMSPAHQWDPLPATYADADGSGTIDADDICGIAQNWELNHSDKSATESSHADVIAALKQVDDNVLEDMFAGLLECTESRGKEALLKILGEMIKRNNPALPTTVELDQNFPNPFNPTTTISYSLDKRRFVEIDIFNLNGRLVKRLENGIKDAGTYSISWDGTDDEGRPASSGIYFYRLKTGNQTMTRKMMLLK